MFGPMLKCVSGRWRARKWIPVNISKVKLGKMSYAGMGRTFYIACFSLLLGVVSANKQGVKESLVEQLDEENWDRMLHGEWMVEL